MLNDDEPLLRRAVDLAIRGRGWVEPNPMVGCVIARGGGIIGEGFHGRFGGPHAEANALAACSEDPRGATAYVTLEPCCHDNKKTPPCAPRLIAAGIARVVVGCFDPNPLVNGHGVAMLRAAGITVDGPLLERSCMQLIAPFLLRVNHQRPYVTLKWAETADHAVAGPGGRPLQITDERSTRIVHRLRARCDAIAVGINTVLSDDPLLTARPPAARRLLRYVLDRSLRMPLDSRLVRSAAPQAPVIVACADAGGAQADALRSTGVIVIEAPDFAAVLADQYGRGVTHLLVEPGPTLARSLMPQADRIWRFRSAIALKEPATPHAPRIPAQFQRTGHAALGSITLDEWLNTAGAGFFAPETSADFRQMEAGERLQTGAAE